MLLSHCTFQLGFDRRLALQWERGTGRQGCTPQPSTIRVEGPFVYCTFIAEEAKRITIV